jgi:tetratricopeptide (TPR) repeat protein
VKWPEDATEALAAAERLALLNGKDDAVAAEVRRFWRQRRGVLPRIDSSWELRKSMKAGNFDEAAAALARLRMRDGASAQWRDLRIELSMLRGDIAVVEEFIGSSGINEVSSVPLLCLLAETAFDAGNLDRALAATTRGLEISPNDARLHRLRLEVAGARADEPMLLTALEQAIEDLDKDPKAGVAFELSVAKDYGRLLRILKRMEEKWSGSRLARQVRQTMRRARMTADANDPTGGAENLQSLAINAKLHSDDVAFQSAIGRLEARSSASAPMNAQLCRAIRNIEAVRDLRRPIISPTYDKDVHISPPGDSGISVLAFLGLAHQLFVPIELIDAYLARRGISAVYLADRRNAAFMAGVESLGADWKETNEALRGIVKRLGTQRLITIGSSAGGPGTVSHGLALQAEAILGLSGIYTGDAQVRSQIGDARARLVAYKAQQSVGELCHMPHLFDATAHRPRVHLYFGSDQLVDRRNAELLATFENVKLFPLDAPCGHNTGIRLLHERRLERAINLAIDGEAPEQSSLGSMG